jgi:hypothetical protein
MNWFVLKYALRLIVVFAGTLVVLMVPVGLMAMLLIAAVVILAVLPDPMWILRRLKTIGTRKSRDYIGEDD